MTLALGLMPLVVVRRIVQESPRRVAESTRWTSPAASCPWRVWSFGPWSMSRRSRWCPSSRRTSLPHCRPIASRGSTPESETPRVFVMGAVNTGITLLTLKNFTTAGALFPGVIMMTDSILERVDSDARRTARCATYTDTKESLA